jgi:beta-mannosidase
MFGQSIDLKWQIGYHKTEGETPAKWVPSTVPGAVQLDVMKGENYKQPWWYAENVHQFDWMGKMYFTYKTSFKKPNLKNGNRLFFFSKGIDYQFKIYLNDQHIWEQEGMFTFVDVDLTDFLKEENELKIVLMPVPDLGQSRPRLNARESVKPAYSFGWDWNPSLITRGIWDETFLIVRKQVRLKEVALEYTLNNDLTKADLQLKISGVQLQGCSFQWKLKNPAGKTVIEKTETLAPSPVERAGGEVSAEEEVILSSELTNPELWWPNGYGSPNLYSYELLLMDSKGGIIEKQTSKVGFRKIKLVLNTGANGGSFPVTQPQAPACFEVNNRRIFAKGCNWAPIESFPGVATPERYREQLVLAQQAYFNLFRINGVGYVNKESFFDICDELGIMVMQEFPLSCMNYPDNNAFLKVLEQEANAIVKHVKKHACLALWSGGNELFQSWSNMTEQSLALRLLNSICYRLDPQTPFIYTSPIYGIAHGHYLFYDPQRNQEVFQWMPLSKQTAYAEFGVASTANVEILKSIIPTEELFPPQNKGSYTLHHAFGAWGKEGWLNFSTLNKYFGEITSLEEMVQYSQFLQCEGLKFIYEEARRQKPFCSMALNWCYNEPWPTAANNSIISYPTVIKPAYYHVANACRPVLASIRAPKFQWKEGDDFACELFLLNDTYDKIEKAVVTVSLQYDGKEETLERWDFDGTDAFKNKQGPTTHFRIPQMKTNLFSVLVRVEGKSEYNSVYNFVYEGNDVQKIFPSKRYCEGKEENYQPSADFVAKVKANYEIQKNHQHSGEFLALSQIKFCGKQAYSDNAPWRIGPFKPDKTLTFKKEKQWEDPLGFGWESGALFVPSLIIKDKKLYMIYRAAPKKEVTSCRFGLAVYDGKKWKDYEKNPILYTLMPNENMSVEDPKVYRAEGRYFMFYISVYEPTEEEHKKYAVKGALGNGKIACDISLAVSDDLLTWERLGTVVPREISHLWAKNAVIPKDKNGDAVKINGKYLMFISEGCGGRHGAGNQHVGISDNMIDWTFEQQNYLDISSLGTLEEVACAIPEENGDGLVLDFFYSDKNKKFAAGQAYYKKADPYKQLALGTGGSMAWGGLIQYKGKWIIGNGWDAADGSNTMLFYTAPVAKK